MEPPGLLGEALNLKLALFTFTSVVSNISFYRCSSAQHGSEFEIEFDLPVATISLMGLFANLHVLRTAVSQLLVAVGHRRKLYSFEDVALALNLSANLDRRDDITRRLDAPLLARTFSDGGQGVLLVLQGRIRHSVSYLFSCQHR